MRIAMPLMEEKGEQSRIHPHFGHVNSMAVYDTQTKKLDVVKVQPIQGCSPIAAIEGLRIDAIYTFGMGSRAIEICEKLGIKVKTGSYRTVGEVVENMDKLEDLHGSCGH